MPLHRFPFLLQDDDTFHATLLSHGWKASDKKQNFYHWSMPSAESMQRLYGKVLSAFLGKATAKSER